MSDLICPGACNNGFRRAREAHAKAVDEWALAEAVHAAWRRTVAQHGADAAGLEPERWGQPEEPTIRPWPGDPIWCAKCTASIRRALTDLDELMSLRLLHTDGYQVPGDPLGEKVRKSSSEAPSLSPGQDELDELVDWLNEWEQALRDTQNWGTIPYRGVAAPALTSAVGWLLPRLDVMLAHPDLAEGFGKGVFMQHARLQSTTRTRAPMRHKPLPCPRCRRRSLFLHDDETVRCNGRDPDCGKIMSKKEYSEYEDAADQQVAS